MNFLIQFSVENFLSFKEKQTFVLHNNLSDKSLEKNMIKIENEKFTISPVAAIYGANGTGKTNLLKAIGFLKYLLTTNSTRMIGEEISIFPFKLTPNAPTTFEVIFIANNKRYGYSIQFNKEKVLKEEFYCYPKGRIKKIYEREYIKVEGEKNIYNYSYSREYQNIFKTIEIKSLPNKLFLATLAEWIELDEIKDAMDFFQNKIIINIDFLNPNWQHYTAKQLEDNEELRNIFLKLLKEINPTIKDIRSKIVTKKISLEELPSEIPMELKLLLGNKESFHTDIKIIYEAENLVLDLSEESRGIQKLFEIGGPLLNILSRGEVLIFDELETSLHPLLSKKIIELFLNKKYNKKGAQLIFSTHDTNLLDLSLLRRDQIWFTEKGKETEYSTKLICLSQIKGIRKDENIKKGFLQGKYTKIPFITGQYIDEFFGEEDC